MFLSPNYRLREARGCDTLSNRRGFRMLRFGGPQIVLVLFQIIQQTASTTLHPGEQEQGLTHCGSRLTSDLT